MQPGERVADRFDLERLMGSGGMGMVWRAMDATTGRAVALKVMLGEASRDRFEQEAALLASLEHPGIVRYVSHGTTDGVPYLAMEWLEGESLHARLARGPLGIEA